MANTNDWNVVHIDNQQRNISGNNKKVLIITSTEDNNEILSCLATSNADTVIVDLNDASIINTQQDNSRKKRALSPPNPNESVNSPKSASTKRRKADLTCIICEGRAFGYNFDQITCESCKAFFRRNALHPIEKTKCISSRNAHERCPIRFDVKNKCQRCRLQKCFECGMRKDYILTPEEKVSKQRRIEENRRMRAMKNSSEDRKEIKIETTTSPTKIEPITISLPTPTSFLTAADWSCLTYIQSAYSTASQSSPSASTMMPIELALDNMSAFMYTFDIQHFTAVKLINFFRAIPEFDSLNEHDRLVLVKDNLISVFFVRHSITFDPTRELCYDDDKMPPISPADEAFAHQSKSLFILCYGYEFNLAVMSVLHTLFRLIDKDPMIAQLLMLVMIFLKGLLADDDHPSMLVDSQGAFYAQCKYTDLLFRYFLERSSYSTAVHKMTNVVEQLVKIQRVSRDFHRYIKSKANMVNINPLMKSLLHLT